jgi:acyl-CoA synthetase (NDP forming)
MAGPIELYGALFEKLGVWSVQTLDQLYQCAQLDWWDDRIDGGLAALSFSGGQAALLADAAEDDGLRFVDLSSETVRRLQAATGAEAVHHPFDCGGQVVNDPERWTAALAALGEQDDVYGLMVALSAVAGGRDAILTDGLIELAGRGRNVALMWSGGTDPMSTVPTLAGRGIPVFERIEDGTACLRIRQEQLSRPVASDAERAAYVESLAATAAGADGVDAVDGIDTAEVLANVLRNVGLKIPAEIACGSVDDVMSAFAQLGGPVVLKAATLLHKSDAGGVVVGLTHDDAVREAARRMSEAHGFPLLLQQQVSGSREVILGISRSELGVAVVAGAGGVLTEFVRDSVTMLAPLDPERVCAALERLAIGRLLAGFRGLSPASLDPIVAAAVALGRFGIEHPAVESVDLNPVMVSDDASGYWAVDRKVVAGGMS